MVLGAFFVLVEEKLRFGALTPRALVLESSGWCTLLESPRFAEVASDVEAKLGRSRLIRKGVLIALWSLVALGLLLMLANVGTFLSWLALDDD